MVAHRVGCTATMADGVWQTREGSVLSEKSVGGTVFRVGSGRRYSCPKGPRGVKLVSRRVAQGC